MSDERIGLVGLGNLGLPVARSLARSFDVDAYDIRDDISDLAGSGIDRVASTADIARSCDVAILCLPSPDASMEVLRSFDTSQRRVRTVVEISTIGVEAAERSAAVASELGLGYVDAPVSGGPQGADDATLAVMAAGESAPIEDARNVLQAVSTSFFHLGDQPGSAQAMKLINNIVNATSLAVTSEALAVGSNLGLDLRLMVDVLNESTGRTTASESKFPTAVIPGEYGTFARGEILLKDLDLYLGSTPPGPAGVTLAVHKVWSEFVAAHPDTDVAYVYQHLRSGMLS